MLLSCPLWAPRRQECPSTATLHAAIPRQWLAADAPKFPASTGQECPKTQLCLRQSPSSSEKVGRAFAQRGCPHGHPAGHPSAKPWLQPASSARKGHLTNPATEDLSLWRESITPSITSPALSAESRAPLGWPPGWGRTQPSAWVGGGSSDGEAACGHWTSSALTFPFPTLCISCCLGRGVNFCSNFTREFVGRSAMGSWCAASKHPWRHAQKFGGILQPRHLAHVHCSVAVTGKLPAAHCDLSDESLLRGRGMRRQLRGYPRATHLHTLGEQEPKPGHRLQRQKHLAAALRGQLHLKAKAKRWRAFGGMASVQRRPPRLSLKHEPALTSALAETQSELQDKEAADTRLCVARSFASAEALLAGRTEH